MLSLALLINHLLPTYGICRQYKYQNTALTIYLLAIKNNKKPPLLEGWIL